MSQTVRITVTLTSDEASRLIKVAESQFRHPREQAHMFIAESLDSERKTDPLQELQNGEPEPVQEPWT